MSELRKAEQVIESIRRSTQSGTPGWAWYSPGDSTKYRILLITAYPVHLARLEEAKPYNALLVQVIDTVPTDPKSVLVTEPSEYNKFTPDMWLDLGYPAGWWAAVRPLLAVLDWTDDQFSSQVFEPSDGRDIDYALTARNRRRPVRAW